MKLFDPNETLLASFVAHDTSTEQGARAHLAELTQRLEDLKRNAKTEIALQVAQDPQTHEPTALLARLGPQTEGGLVLSGHIDVVPAGDLSLWETPPFVLTERDDKLFGRGSVDMGASLACIFAALPFWAQKDLQRPLYLSLTTDEERGFETIGHNIAFLAAEPRPKAAIVVEPTMMEIVAASKGTNPVDVTIRGKAAHSSHPELGIDAGRLENLLKTYLYETGDRFQTEARDGRFDPPFPTVNIGTGSFGTARNIVPAEARFQMHFRQIYDTQADQAVAAFRTYAKTLVKDPRFAKAQIDIVSTQLPALEPRATNAATDCVRQASPKARITTAAFGSEAGYLQKAGIDTVIFGPGSIEQAHAANEFVSRQQVASFARFLKRLAW